MVAAELHLQQEILQNDHFDPMEEVDMGEKPYTILPNYGDPWTQRFRGEDAILAKASGYSTAFTYSRSLDAAYTNLYHNVF
jgi:hypothetical protein